MSDEEKQQIEDLEAAATDESEEEEGAHDHPHHSHPQLAQESPPD